MTSASWIFVVWGAAAATAWLAAQAWGLRTALVLQKMGDWRSPAPRRWPRLTVIVAACDEADHLESAVESLLGQDYPDLEIVVVDDRSEDATGRIVDLLAARHPNVRGLHVTDLPEGWLGKVHALHTATRAASGDFLLFTDADVHFERGVLRRAVARCEECGIDHLAVAPLVHSPGFLQESVVAAFMSGFMLGTRAFDVARPGSKAFAGVGAFNLVRRSVFDRTPGFEWLRMEVLDDVGLGLMMHRAGARKEFAVGLGELRITWYPSLSAMARGLEKNIFGAVARYSYARLATFLVLSFAVFGGMAVALVQPWSAGVRVLGAAALAAVAVNALAIRARTGVALGPLLLAPAGGLILVGILLRSAVQCLRRGGIVWRGTLYPVDELRAGQRVRL